jgi:hypothetical protein
MAPSYKWFPDTKGSQVQKVSRYKLDTKIQKGANKNSKLHEGEQWIEHVTLTCQTSTGLDVWQVVRRVLYLRPRRLR